MTTSTGVNGKEEAKDEVPGIYPDLQQRQQNSSLHHQNLKKSTGAFQWKQPGQQF